MVPFKYGHFLVSMVNFRKVYRLFNRNPYNGLLQSPHSWGGHFWGVKGKIFVHLSKLGLSNSARPYTGHKVQITYKTPDASTKRVYLKDTASPKKRDGHFSKHHFFQGIC